MSPPPFDPDDPRLTAYALGEADETDRQAVERMLADSEESRKEVEQTKQMARVLAAEYAREREIYLAQRNEAEWPSNIVAFRNEQGRAWRQTITLALKIAAVVALAASLVYLTLRRPRRLEFITVASSPPGEWDHASTSRPADSDRFSKDKEVVAQSQKKLDSSRASDFDQQPTAAPAPTPALAAGIRVDSLLAMQRPERSKETPELAADGQTVGTIPRAAAAPPAPTSAALNAVPGAPPTAGAIAPPRPAGPIAISEQIARSVVRIRTTAGAFFGGVIVSTDGVILAVTDLPESALQRPCTVFLSDRCELSAVAKPTQMNSGWYRLLIDGKELPAAALAKDFPANDAALTVVSVDPRTGMSMFSSAPADVAGSSRRASRPHLERSRQAVGSASFAFNPAGELLVIDRATEESQTASHAKGSSDSPASENLLVRPFTEAERRMLRPAATTNGHE